LLTKYFVSSFIQLKFVFISLSHLFCKENEEDNQQYFWDFSISLIKRLELKNKD
jgi:hypothetical protein